MKLVYPVYKIIEEAHMSKGKLNRDELKLRSKGEIIAKIRKQLGLTQAELAWRSGISKSEINRVENSQVYPSILTIKRLEGAMGVPVMELYNSIEQDTSEFLSQIRTPGEVLIEFEKELARRQLTQKELKTVLKKVLNEIEKEEIRKLLLRHGIEETSHKDD